MNIQILNNDLSLHGIVSGCEQMEFSRAWNTQGNFRIVINANNANAKYLSVDKIVYIDQDKIGYIDKITVDKKTDKAGQYLTAEGVELKDRLNRVIYPDSYLINDSYTNQKLETVIKSLINKNAGSLASSTRQIPNLKTAADQARGPEVDYSARYKDLSQELYLLLMSNEMGLKAAIDFDNADIVFDVAEGNDKTAAEGQAGGIVLSLNPKTALAIVDTNDRLSVKNLSITAGLGDDENRTIQEVYTQTSEPAGYNRREVFTDARDIKSDDELETRGAQKLGETQKARAISVKANTLGSYKIGTDYDLGDYISVDAGGELYDLQIIKIKYRYDKTRVPEINLVLNCDVDDSLHSSISARHMNYDALLAKDAGGGRKLVSEKIFTAAASSHTFTGLDVNADGGTYIIEVLSYAPAQVNMRINGDTADTNYRYNFLANTTAVSGNNNLASSSIAPLTSTAGMIQISAELSLVNNNGTKYPAAIVTTGYQKSNAIYQMNLVWGKWANTGNITQIQILNAGGNFGVGTKIRIWKVG